MNFTHLKAFYNVAKYRSFTLAARELNVSQSTLSLQVQNLERQYDIPLIKRTKKAIELTDEGKIVFSYAKRIFSLAHEMERTIEDLNATQSGKLKIGSTQLLARYMLPNIFLALKESNPELRIQLYTGLSREILSKVIDFEYHVGLIGRVSYPGNIICKQISKQKLHLITTDRINDQIRLKDLSNYPLILREEGSATREYIINEFAKRNIPLNNYIESQNPDAIKRMVHLGMGGAFFPSYSIEEDVQEGRFRKIEIVDHLYLCIDLIYLMERRKSKTLRSFISVVSEYSF
jgi:DNA-binding transcriptional LysR family regulator